MTNLLFEVLANAGLYALGALSMVGATHLLKKPKKEPQIEPLPDNVVPWAWYRDKQVFGCPKCCALIRNQPQYCDCAEYQNGHYHLVCKPSISPEKDERKWHCGYKCIMLTIDETNRRKAIDIE